MDKYIAAKKKEQDTINRFADEKFADEDESVRSELKRMFAGNGLSDKGKTEENLFGAMPKFEKDSKEYKQGLEYINATENHVPYFVDHKKCKANLLEKEVFDTGEKANNIYRYFESIWE